ncbi:MAG: tRNA threonylcarbamoyladenosine biosynthesis protein TsaB [Phycisphaerales bacterium]
MRSGSDKVFGLAIESSNPSSAGEGALGGPGVALAEVSHDAGKWVVAGEILTESLKRGTGREDDLMAAIDRVSKRTGIGAKQIGLVAVSVGPGGFTALRVAVTAGNVIAFATGASCSAVPSALVAASKVECSGRFAVMLASKADSAFATIFEPGWRRAGHVHPGRLVRAADIAALDVEFMVADKFLPAVIAEAASKSGIQLIDPTFDPAACLELGCAMPIGDPGSLKPLYAREPEAVTLWKARQKR